MSSWNLSDEYFYKSIYSLYRMVNPCSDTRQSEVSIVGKHEQHQAINELEAVARLKYEYDFDRSHLPASNLAFIRHN